MSKYVRIENGEVIECLDYLPVNSIGDWREAVDIYPAIVSGRQIINSHYFDVNKSPVEIIWQAIDITVDDRKNILLGQLNQQSYQIVHSELIKEFEGHDSDFTLVQSAINVYRLKRTEILGLSSHDQIDAFELENH